MIVRVVSFARKNEGVNERDRMAKGAVDTGEMSKVEGCVWVLSTISLIFLRTETNFCHACKRLRVYSMYRRTIDALYFRYGEKY